MPSEFEADEEEPLIRKKEEIPAKPPKRRKKGKSHRIADPEEELGRLQQELKVACPQKKRKLMRGTIPVHDTREQIYEQHRLHNQGARMEAQEEAQQAPPAEQAIPVGTPPPKTEHGSNQKPPVQVPGDMLSTLEISKMAESQNNPYLNLLDEEVNQPAEQINQGQREPAVLQDDQVFQDLPNFDHMSELKGEELKAFEAQQEQEQSTAFTLQQLLVDEQPKQDADKGKSKVEEESPVPRKWLSPNLWMNHWVLTSLFHDPMADTDNRTNKRGRKSI